MKTNHPSLQNWSTTYGVDVRYRAPECLPPLRLQGNVYNHPEFEDGERVLTSPIHETKGRLVTTQSGEKYYLSRPDQRWLRWLKSQGKAYDPKQPIKRVERA